jgi:hypothetical protein
MADFPDRKYIETIRQALWNGSEFGRAAVMIGSGFSRNAEPVGIQTARFPLWGQRFPEHPLLTLRNLLVSNN